jgi:putative ATP-dependent endonuclease of OLD family
MGYDFALEGIACVEFAQCGLDPLIKVAEELGIEWHVLADGDKAGTSYADTARRLCPDKEPGERLTLLKESDIERCFWDNGYEHVYQRYARLPDRQLRQLSTARVIQTAVRKRSKPFLALSMVEAIARKDSPGIPDVLRSMIENCVGRARSAPSRFSLNM